MGDDRAFAQGLKLAAIAVVSAVLTATLIIGAGEAMMRRSAAMAPPTPETRVGAEQNAKEKRRLLSEAAFCLSTRP
ncbi:MAG: hypothetical protein ACK4MI_11915 [Brevundimonas sp.]|uniref:hypothetical protein n=1 Tax=Brevundimonas sp. TaxID=1871086 RepID=UPI00391D3EC8